MIPDIDTEIKLSLWLIEVWLPDVRQWRVDKITRLEKYAAAYIAAMMMSPAWGGAIQSSGLRLHRKTYEKAVITRIIPATTRVMTMAHQPWLRGPLI